MPHHAVIFLGYLIFVFIFIIKLFFGGFKGKIADIDWEPYFKLLDLYLQK